jgi:hypothetical protein
MNSDADTLRSFLIGLLDYFSPAIASPSGGVDGGSPQSDQRASGIESSGESGTSGNFRRFTDDPAAPSSDSSDNTRVAFEMPPLSELGELPAVQTHFQSLLKRRLQTEIEQNPPLFPWETELQEYPVGVVATAASPWMVQLRSLNLPTVLPDDILSTLLSRCQALLRDGVLKPGQQLVEAVQVLFPEQPEAMNQIAGLVVAGPTRSGPDLATQPDIQNAFPEGYGGANPQQQITVAMLAARDIFDALTLTLSPRSPQVERQWDTALGVVTVTCTYQPTEATVHIAAHLPGAGALRLGSDTNLITSQGQGGQLQLTLSQPELGRCYPLEVSLGSAATAPLTLSLIVNAEP